MGFGNNCRQWYFGVEMGRAVELIGTTVGIRCWVCKLVAGARLEDGSDGRLYLAVDETRQDNWGNFWLR